MTKNVEPIKLRDLVDDIIGALAVAEPGGQLERDIVTQGIRQAYDKGFDALAAERNKQRETIKALRDACKAALDDTSCTLSVDVVHKLAEALALARGGE